MAKKMVFKKPWIWDPAAQSLTIRVPGGTIGITGDKAEPLRQVMGGFVISGSAGLEATLISPGGQLIRLEIRPAGWTPSPHTTADPAQ